MSFAASASWPAETVTVCAEFQLVVVNVSVDEGTVTSVLFELMATVTPDGQRVQSGVPAGAALADRQRRRRDGYARRVVVRDGDGDARTPVTEP